MVRSEIARYILEALNKAGGRLKECYQESGRISHFYIDDLLPRELAIKIYEAFPASNEMVRKKSLREYKYIAAQMDNYDPILEEAIYAFQDDSVVRKIGDLVGAEKLMPDENLYAGGISLMRKGNYLNPHLDNSHDKDRVNWRAFNLLYYVTPGWELSDGGNLELWPSGPTLLDDRIVIESKFNRLAVMVTHNESWHSVSPVVADKNRCCVSNYYFSKTPMQSSDSFHVTSFRGRPEQRIRDIALRADIRTRSAIRKVFKKGIVENPHVYKK